MLMMIPTGDHSSRSIVHRRVSSWAEVTNGPPPDESMSLFSSDDDDLLSHPLLSELGLEYEESLAGSEGSMSLISLLSSYGKCNWKLGITYVILVISGVSNVVLAKLQSLPMYNYPTFLNMYSNFMYIVLSFCYILPASLFGWCHGSIPRRHLTNMPIKPFFVMGLLDAISGFMQLLGTIYLPGTLLVLLPQAAIPLSMLASRVLLREKFTRYQYLGAVVVLAGIVVVLFPVLTHKHAPEYSCQAVNEDEDCTVCQMETSKEDCLSHMRRQQQQLLQSLDYYSLVLADSTTEATTTTSMFWDATNDTSNNSTVNDTDDEDNTAVYCQWISKNDSLRKDDFLVFVWSLVMVASCVPMVLSSVYKQVALQVHVDPILVNGWVAVFQFFFSLPMAIPAGLVSSPKVKPWRLPGNWLDGTQCLFANVNSIDTGCHPDRCDKAALWVHLGLLSSVAYTLSMIFVLKYGSISLLYLGLTLMVPLGHLVFSLNYPSNMNDGWDVAGLLVLVAGLILYRFGHNDDENNNDDNNNNHQGEEGDADIPAGGGDNAEGDGLNHLQGYNNNRKDGFLEFLREPFMLVGDI